MAIVAATGHAMMQLFLLPNTKTRLVSMLPCASEILDGRRNSLELLVNYLLLSTIANATANWCVYGTASLHLL